MSKRAEDPRRTRVRRQPAAVRPRPATYPNLATGAVAFVDALGFKGISPRFGARRVLDKLRDAYNEKRLEEHRDRGFPTTIMFLSDTIVVAIEVNPRHSSRPVYERMVALSLVCEFTRVLILDMLMTDPPLAYRGAIAFGEFLAEAPFIIGPAIDEAAEAERKADGAFVWFTPSALGVYHEAVAGKASFWNHDILSIPACSYAVPMKKSPATQTMVLVLPGEEASTADVLARYEIAMGSDPREASKRENTFRFVREAVVRTA